MMPMRRHAWILALLGLLAMLFHLVARLVWGHWGSWPAWVGGAGLALWVVWLFLDWRPLRRASRSRALRQDAVAVLLVLMALGLAVGINVLAERYDQRWDLTSTGRHSLAPQTVQLLQGLHQDVTLVAFFPVGSTDEQSFLDLLEAYQQHSERLQVQLYDPYRDPVAARQHGVTSAYGTVVLELGDAQQRLETAFDEEALSNALMKLVSGVQHTVCFLQDHGECDPDDDEGWGISGAVMKLEGQNYLVERSSILQHGGVPEFCEAVVVAAPTVDLLPEERESLAAYLVGGGNGLFLLEPLMAESTSADLARYGLDLRQDLVLVDNPELRQLGFDPSYLRVAPTELDYHPITNDLDSVVYLEGARSVSKVQDLPPGLNVQVLARTGTDAWAETDLSRDSDLQPTVEADLVGNVGLAAAVEIVDASAVPVGRLELASFEAPLAGDEAEAPAADPEPEPEPAPSAPSSPGGRLVVFGDASFASNQHLLEGLNQDLFLNSVAWLVGEEDQISIRPNEAGSNLLQYDLLQALLTWFLCLLGIPGLAVAAALWTWLRRRRM